MAGNRNNGPTGDSVDSHLDLDITRQIPERAKLDLLWTIRLMAEKVGLHKLRFKSQPGMSFPTREVESILETREEDEVKYEFRANVCGLDGVSGPLPFWLNEILSLEEPETAPVGDFLDIFSHRFIESLFLAWAKRTPALAYQRGGRDGISRILFSLMGLDHAGKTPKPRESGDFIPARLLCYVGSLGHRSRSMPLLRGILRDYFENMDISIREFVLRKVTIPEAERSRLGINGMMLGKDFVPGEQIGDISGGFRIAVGPLDMETFMAFLPGGIHYRHLVKLVKMYVSHLYTWDLALRIKGGEIPGFRLGSREPELRLGRGAWLKSLPRGDDEVIFQPE